MSSKQETFTPSYGYGASITAGGTSANTLIDSNKNRTSMVITNTGTDLVYVRPGNSTVAATIADYPVIGGTQVSIGKSIDDTHCAVIAPAGAPVVKVIAGIGI